MRLRSLLCLAPLVVAACRPDAPAASGNGPPLRLVHRLSSDDCAYLSAAGDTVIPFGRYYQSETSLFDNVAVVLKPKAGWVAIDRQERVLYHLFIYAHGPDYPAEGAWCWLPSTKRRFLSPTAEPG